MLDLFLGGSKVAKSGAEEETVTIQATKQLNYRQNNIFYKNNEISLTLVENLNALFSQSGQMLQADVKG